MIIQSKVNPIQAPFELIILQSHVNPTTIQSNLNLIQSKLNPNLILPGCLTHPESNPTQSDPVSVILPRQSLKLPMLGWILQDHFKHSRREPSILIESSNPLAWWKGGGWGGFKSSYRSQRFHSHQDLLGIPSGSSESNWIEQMDLSKRRRFVRIRPPFCRTEISHRFQNGFKILKKKLNPSGNLQGFDTDLIRIGLGFPSRFIRLRFLSCWDLITRISLPPPSSSFFCLFWRRGRWGEAILRDPSGSLAILDRSSKCRGMNKDQDQRSFTLGHSSRDPSLKQDPKQPPRILPTSTAKSGSKSEPGSSTLWQWSQVWRRILTNRILTR